jgi:hypothetical protein
MCLFKSLKKGVGSGVRSGSRSISQRCGSGSAPKCHGSLTLVVSVNNKILAIYLQQPQQLPPAPFPQQQQQPQQAEPGKREEAAGPGRPDAGPVRQEAVRPAGYAAAAAGRFTTPICIRPNALPLSKATITDAKNRQIIFD